MFCIEFPVPVSSKELARKKFYHSVLDDIQLMCKRARKKSGVQDTPIFPCVLDAAVFIETGKIGRKAEVR